MRRGERPQMTQNRPMETQRPDGELDFEAQGPCVPPWKIACGSEPANGLRIGIWEWQDGPRWRELPDLTWPLLERGRRSEQVVTLELRPRKYTGERDCSWTVDPSRGTMLHRGTGMERRVRRNTCMRAVWEWDDEAMVAARLAAALLSPSPALAARTLTACALRD